ncbi:hypothetical protein ACFPVS_08955 [Neisseria weixii]|uniref:hypothetical protein n=1 Tax=Neisseria weixii TaxID=1853276 RepID=UPI000BB9B1FA|nr:hypothetical protein [Neisseria weixii]ATD64116.1 hypothetical protein CGZ65_00025 [Neisseria weixii]ATD65876.1 hypothetical protein CGZ65_12565 [Neisseria weixii]
MFNTTRTPVKLYKWDDPGAPQVSYTQGSIKTVLKACLISGYGDGDNRKEPLGWKISFEEDYKAVFAPKDDEAEGWALSADDSWRGNTGNQTDSGARCRIILNPTSISNGEIVNSEAWCGFSYSSFKGSGKWWLVGNGRAFVLVTSDSSSSRECGFLYFGLFPSVADRQSGNLCLGFVGGFGSAAYTGGSLHIQYARSYDYLSGAGGRIVSKANGYYSVKYPNPATGGFCADDCYLLETANSLNMLAGSLPGCMMIFEDMPTSNEVPFGKIFKDLDGSGDQYLYCRVNGRGMLVNLNAWEM